MKKFTTFILLCAIIVSAFSCGEAPSVTETTAASTETEPAVTGEVARESTPDSLPSGLDFGGEVISVMFPESHGGAADQIDWVSEDNGDIVNSAVYNRQVAVEERLNVKFEVHSEYKVTAWKDTLKNSVMAGDGGFDLVYGPQSDTSTLITQDMYLNLKDAKYIDYDQPWWNNAIMEELSAGENRYLLARDISLSMLSYMSCMYFNKDRFETVTGEASETLYETVLDGKWTMDKLAAYCKQSYSDLNGNSEYDDADSYGMGAVTASTTDHMTFDSGIRFTTKDKDGIPQLTMNNERTVLFAEKLYSLFYENEGVRVFPSTQDTLRVLIPNKLINSEMTFMCGYFYSANLLRDMKSDYGIIPYPKLDESIDHYGALVHDSAMLVSVPVTCQKTDAVFAAIEAIAAENYRTVTPAYYEIALKTKYVRDDISGQIIDMIHESGTTDFAFVYSLSMSKIGHIMRSLMTDKTKDFSSAYAKLKEPAIEGLNNLIEAFKAVE